MRIIVDYTEEVATPFQASFFVRVAEEALRRCPYGSVADKDGISCTVVAVSEEKIRELNRTYRAKDAVTDILSFGEYADMTAYAKDDRKDIFLGEIYFCQDVIARAAKEDGVTILHEMAYIFSHGILHLIGYDHSDEMFSLQDAVTEHMVAEETK